MSACKFPEHHGSGRSIVPVVLMAVAAFVVWRFLHAAELVAVAVALVLVLVVAWRCRRHLRTAAGLAALLVWFARLAWVFPPWAVLAICVLFVPASLFKAGQ